MKFEELIESQLGQSYLSVLRYALSASKRYKRYKIKKRTDGYRIIHHPTKKLKEYQRFIAKNIFLKMPLHDKVFSYRKTLSIKDLAKLHIKNRYLLRVDFKDFFPSINGSHIREFLNNNKDVFDFEVNDRDITIINLIVCKNDKLTIGAPSSPAITNAILFEFDNAMDHISENIVYSRYADDLYFSSNIPDLLTNIPKNIKSFLENYFIKLKINDDKTVYTSKKHKRQILGLTITTGNQLSIGRTQKQKIKSLVYKYNNGNLTSEEINYLKGYISYLYSVEPDYINILRRKYSNKIVNELLPIKNI